MLFNSFIFIFAFLPVTLTGYFCINRWGKFSVGKVWLILASLVFYAYFNVSYLAIIVTSIAVNYALSQCMLISQRGWLRRLCFAASLLANVGALAYYKYFDFFVININQAFGSDFVLRNLLLPLGISFFTFQQLSYVVDSYKRTVPRYNLVDYALFVTFFPQLIAGPIVLHSEIVPQFADPANRRFRYENFAPGLYAFAIGLAKKALIADTFAKVANYGFATNVSLNTPEAFLVILAFTLQLYFDFSGYCDMAVGLSRMFNIKAPNNFNSPLKALSIREFWARWHITLGRFFRLYVYIPLGGNRKGEFRTCLSLMAVFVVSGLWHGAGWLFLLWGALHGVAAVAYRLCHRRYDGLHPAFRWLITFAFVSLAFVFFRAQTMDSALGILGSLFSFEFGPLSASIMEAFQLPFDLLAGSVPSLTLAAYAGALALALGFRNTYELTEAFTPAWYRSPFCILLLFASIMSLSGVSVFLYYNF
ncbi:MAG: MBOAT family protein [Clostridia bacterium]|nr:MBOAT family protein [Clostridia bacterium]